MLEGLPSGMLGALTSLVFIIVFIIRFLILKKFVHRSPLINQAKNQFFSEYSLVLLAGILMVFLDYFILSIPFVSGIVFFIGFIAFGFFIAIDMSLLKERSVIKDALENSDVIKVPQQFFPLTRKFFNDSWVKGQNSNPDTAECCKRGAEESFA